MSVEPPDDRNGWWQASDGRWYPPVAAPPPPGPPPSGPPHAIPTAGQAWAVPGEQPPAVAPGPHPLGSSQGAWGPPTGPAPWGAPQPQSQWGAPPPASAPWPSSTPAAWPQPSGVSSRTSAPRRSVFGWILLAIFMFVAVGAAVFAVSEMSEDDDTADADLVVPSTIDPDTFVQPAPVDPVPGGLDPGASGTADAELTRMGLEYGWDSLGAGGQKDFCRGVGVLGVDRMTDIVMDGAGPDPGLDVAVVRQWVAEVAAGRC